MQKRKPTIPEGSKVEAVEKQLSQAKAGAGLGWGGGLRRYGAVVWAAVALLGCTSYKVKYPGDQALRGGTTHPFVNIEFGEQGNARDPEQIKVALDEIKQRRKPLLVIFVHGWHNNATTGEAKNEKQMPKESFSQLLDSLNESELIKHSGFQTIGVYISWRGRMYDDTVLEYGATFWGRYEAGRALGASVACRSVIAELVSEARKRGPRDSRTFLIGHSFGGLVLQQAISDAVINTRSDGTAYPPADLTLFLNPASDSQTTRDIVQRFQSGAVKIAHWSKQRDFPVFVSLTSASDWATGKLFPIGKSLATVSKHFDSYDVAGEEKQVSGSYFYTHTPGNNRFLLSHTTTSPRLVAGGGNSAFDRNLAAAVDPVHPHFESRAKDGKWYRWDVQRVGATVTPYWIMKVRPEIMNGHNDLFNENALALMAMLYRLNREFTDETGSVPTLQRSTAAHQPQPLQSGAATVSKINAIMKVAPSVAKPPVGGTPNPTRTNSPPANASSNATPR